MLEPITPDDLHQRPFLPAAIELAVENLLPRAEVELALVTATTTSRPMIWRFMWASALSAGAVVQILRDGLVGSQGFQPLVVVLV